MTNETKTVKFEYIETDAITTPIYETHKRGKNWLAILNGKNSVHVEMDFLRMSYRTVDTSDLKIGDAIEVGADYISGGGIRNPCRKWYVVKNIDSTGIECIPCTSRADAMKKRFVPQETTCAM